MSCMSWTSKTTRPFYPVRWGRSIRERAGGAETTVDSMRGVDLNRHRGVRARGPAPAGWSRGTAHGFGGSVNGWRAS
jgi:hypothetical protein